jgi:hypothetical protein
MKLFLAWNGNQAHFFLTKNIPSLAFCTRAKICLPMSSSL